MLTRPEQAPWTGALPAPVARWMVRPAGSSAESGAERGPWADRAEAGRVLGQRLGRRLAGRPGAADRLVLGVSGAGVAVAAEVAAVLAAPLDVLLVLPLSPGSRRTAPLVAVAGAGPRVHLVREAPVGAQEAADDVDEAWTGRIAELVARERAVRAGLAPAVLDGRVVVLAVDALVDAAHVVAAVRAVRRSRPAHVVVAAPAGTPSACAVVAQVADEVLCAWTPASAASVERAYQREEPAPPEHERTLLARAAVRWAAAGEGPVR